MLKYSELKRNMSTFNQPLVISFPHFSPPTGGPGSFQCHISNFLKNCGHQIVFPKDKVVPDIIIVIGGTNKLAWLYQCKQQGTKIVQRLDGLNWRHEVDSFPIKTRIIYNLRNWLMWIIRKYFADHVVYQSKFVGDWWHRKYGTANCAESIIYNGTDLSRFRPKEKNISRSTLPSILCVEGNMHDDPTTIKILTTVTKQLIKEGYINKTSICGGILSKAYHQLINEKDIRLLGKVSRKEMHNVYNNADIFFNLEINPPCPNSVIEALAAGLPVVGFDTGSLSELVSSNAGIIVPYKGDPWKLDLPDVSTLINGIKEVINNLEKYSKAARIEAEQRFGLDKMLTLYWEVFKNVLI